MKSVMLTIRLKWFYLTYKGIKTVEVRKSCPKNFNGDVFEVVSKTNFEKDLMEIPENEREFFRQFKGKVGLKFTLNKVEKFEWESCGRDNDGYWKDNGDRFVLKPTCLTYDELFAYIKSGIGYAWYISNLVIFDKPKELSEFKVRRNDCPFPCSICNVTYCQLKKAPQSWCYVEE